MWINDDMYDYLLTLMAATPVNLGTADNFAPLPFGDVGLSSATGSNYAGLTATEVTGTIMQLMLTFRSNKYPSLLTTAK